MKWSLILGVFLLITPSLRSQGQAPYIEVPRGQILQYGESLPMGLTISLRGVDTHEPPQVVPVSPNGTFECRHLAAGEYEATITNEQGEVILHEFVQFTPNSGPFVLRLRDPASLGPLSNRPVNSRTVSARELLHPIPSKAAKEFRRSQKAQDAGDIQGSIKHLEKAIEIDPDYMEAHNNLGARFMALQQYDKSAAEFQKAVELEPTSAKTQFGLSLALSVLGRYPEAEAPARRAVQLDPQLTSALYTLGQVLVMQNKVTPEAEEDLRKSAAKYPRARLMLAKLFALRGDANETAAQLREYLRSGSTDSRKEAEAWLARLSPSATPK